MKNNIKYLLASLFIFLYNTLVFAQGILMPPAVEGGDDPGASDSETPGVPENPIDMYEGILLLVAVSLIIGYYLYKRNRRIA